MLVCCDCSGSLSNKRLVVFHLSSQGIHVFVGFGCKQVVVDYIGMMRIVQVCADEIHKAFFN